MIRDGIYEADALEFLRDLPDASVDLVVTDPPYFRVKGEPWDRQWDSAGAFLDWIGELSAEWARVLKPNGSLYVFASPRMAARVEVTVGQHLNVLNRIRWLKSQGWHRKARKEELRSYLSPWEEIVFAEHYGADSAALGESGYVGACDRLRGFVFESIRAYLDGERRRAGIDKADCNVACGFSHSAGGMASRHYFSQSQWCLPTEQHYAALRRLFNERGRRPAPPYRDYHPADGYFAKVLRADYEYLRADYEYLRADYEYLRADYEHLRADYEYLRADYEHLRADYEHLRADYEHLRRPFTVTADVPYTDVWEFDTVSARAGKHLCEKPLPLLEHIIETSSRPGALVLDSFVGSGATAEAAARLGRRFIGSELSAIWVHKARRRVAPALEEAA